MYFENIRNFTNCQLKLEITNKSPATQITFRKHPKTYFKKKRKFKIGRQNTNSEIRKTILIFQHPKKLYLKNDCQGPGVRRWLARSLN